MRQRIELAVTVPGLAALVEKGTLTQRDADQIVESARAELQGFLNDSTVTMRSTFEYVVANIDSPWTST